MAASTAKKKSAAKSGNPKKRSTASTWKRNKGEELELPSGNVALVKRPGPAALLNQGIMPDTLMPIVQKAIRTGQGLKPEDTSEMLNDPAAIADMLDAMDKLLVSVVVEPKVAYHQHQVIPTAIAATTNVDSLPWRPIPDEARNGGHCDECGQTHLSGDDVIYSDEVEMDDKMFIFNYAVGGTRSLERFREEHGSIMGDLSTESGDEGSA